MRKFSIKVNGLAYEVEVEEVNGGYTTPVVAAAPVAAPVTAPAAVVAAAPAPASAPAPAAAPAPTSGTQLLAPMPGTIVDFKVAPGASVKKGQPVLVLEAMKMENEIAANIDGVISFVTTKGASVNSGDILAFIA